MRARLLSVAWTLAGCVAISASLAASLAAAPAPTPQATQPLPTPLGREILRPMDYQGVRLDAGPLTDQVRQVRDEYLRISNDTYLKGFRRRAGRPAPGQELGGWYRDDRFHVFGQVLSGLARLYAATEDADCKEKLDTLVAGWAECVEPDGYFFYSRHPNSPHYIYEKMVCGLVDAHRYAETPHALEYLDRITTWAEKNLDRSRVFNQRSPGTSQEWYTLSENLYRAYLLTGQQRYRDFARVWEYTEFWDLLRNRQDIFQRAPRYHAYSHVNSLASAAMAYRVTGEKRYLQTIQGGFDYLREHQFYATGGYGPGEGLLPQKQLIESLDGEDRSFETQCGTWAGFKLSKALIAFTGDARYGDWTEQLVLNGIGASLPMSPDGQVTYYSHYGLDGAAKDYTSGQWPCCAGTRIQAVADLADLVFFQSDDALCVNLFTPATCRWSVNGTAVTLSQLTRFPEQNSVHLSISAAKDVTFALKLRSPGWLASPMRVKVNGIPVPASADAMHWVAIQRSWHDGDSVDVELPMELRARRFPESSTKPFPAAITYGPVVLAFDSPVGAPGRLIDFDHLSRSLVPVAGSPLTFRAAQEPRVTARSLHAWKQGEFYYLYVDPTFTWRSVPRERWTRSGSWREGPGLVSREAGAWIECPFEGRAVRWVGRRFNDAGQADVFIDGKRVETVDQFGPRRRASFHYDVSGLPPGPHTLRITVLDGKSPQSLNRYVNVLRIEIPAGDEPER